MDIALIGYGKMGKAIEIAAQKRGHHIVLKIGRDNLSAFSESNLRMADVAIEFTTPESAFTNVTQCMDAGIPVVCGTTGWNQQQEEAIAYCRQVNGSLLLSANFSIGVNLFFEINERVSALMKNRTQYTVSVSETHHVHKKDAPSGTAIRLAEQLLQNDPEKTRWQSTWKSPIAADEEGSTIIPVHSVREDEVPGIHQVTYASDVDTLQLVHTAHSRMGFADGAVLAAAFLKDRTGFYTMKDVLQL